MMTFEILYVLNNSSKLWRIEVEFERERFIGYIFKKRKPYLFNVNPVKLYITSRERMSN